MLNIPSNRFRYYSTRLFKIDCQHLFRPTAAETGRKVTPAAIPAGHVLRGHQTFFFRTGGESVHHSATIPQPWRNEAPPIRMDNETI
jgi:hypothetical protein